MPKKKPCVSLFSSSLSSLPFLRVLTLSALRFLSPYFLTLPLRPRFPSRLQRRQESSSKEGRRLVLNFVSQNSRPRIRDRLKKQEQEGDRDIHDRYGRGERGRLERGGGGDEEEEEVKRGRQRALCRLTRQTTACCFRLTGGTRTNKLLAVLVSFDFGGRRTSPPLHTSFFRNRGVQKPISSALLSLLPSLFVLHLPLKMSRQPGHSERQRSSSTHPPTKVSLGTFLNFAVLCDLYRFEHCAASNLRLKEDLKVPTLYGTSLFPSSVPPTHLTSFRRRPLTPH